MLRTDVAIAGAGLIGLSLALALSEEGLDVAVFSDGLPLAEASTAAAGMLAVDDPHNPPALHPLSRLSRSLYPEMLDCIASRTGLRVAPQTHRTLQQLPRTASADNSPLSPRQPANFASIVPGLKTEEGSFALLDEWSLDPRELAQGTLAACTASGIRIHVDTRVNAVTDGIDGVLLATSAGTAAATHFVDCTGAWSLASQLCPYLRIRPRKGQMLTVRTPAALAQSATVLRSETIYAVPRLHGPRAGHTVIGATVEDAGFDRSVSPGVLASLQQDAARLLPALGESPVLSHWAGLRPSSDDALPLLGAIPGCHRSFIASGHYRNGILLAPATAAILTGMLLGKAIALDLSPFSPERFAPLA